ncbi:hypothetical protein ACWDZ6_03045 [Streptomyces sp. NPDC002926]
MDMMQLWTAIIAAASALLGAWIAQFLTLKSVREQVAAQVAAQQSDQKAEHRLWLREQRASAYEEFLDRTHEAAGFLRDFEKLRERDPNAARAAYSEAEGALGRVERSQAKVATLGPEVVRFAAHHVHVALGIWRHGHELETVIDDAGWEDPEPDSRRIAERANEKAISLFTSAYVEAIQAVLADDGTDPERTRRLRDRIGREVEAANEMLCEHMAPLRQEFVLPPPHME